MDIKKYVLPKNPDALGVLGYSIVVNKQVHNFQIEILDEYLSQFHLKIDDTVLSAILDGNDAAISFNSAIDAFASEKENVKETLVYLIYLLSSIDANINSSEQLVIKQICQSSGLGQNKILELSKDAQNQARTTRNEHNVLFERPFREKVSKPKNFLLRFIYWILRLLGIKKDQEKETSSQEDIDYKDSIRKCAEVAREDFSVIKPSYSTLISSCENMLSDTREMQSILSMGTGISAETAKIINVFIENISKHVLDEGKRANESLIQKERSVPDFTISLVGRTKSGKSTLHSILTNRGREKIGVGSQRTTRYNRVYQWNLLKLIDTPGVGSAEADGRDDDAIAASVLGESDIICLIIRDDSVLQDVLEFVEKIASLNKPIIVLLNHMENITSTTSKFNRFLENPLGWLHDKGEGNLNGHINRIQRYADDHGFGHLIQFYPVFLLPALLAGDEKFQENSKILWEGSNVDSFIEQLKKWITVSGPIKRSQTILDEASQLFVNSQSIINTACEPIEKRLDKLKADHPVTIAKLRKAQDKVLSDLRTALDEKYNELATERALDFANDHYNIKGDLSEYWVDYLDSIGFEKQIKDIIENHSLEFEKLLTDTVNDFFEDMFYGMSNSLQIDVNQKISMFDFRGASKIIGGLFDVAGGILLLVLGTSNPVGWIITGVGLAIGLIAKLFKSKAKRMQEAIDKIYSSVKKSIEEGKDEQIENCVSKFQLGTDSAINKVDDMYVEMITYLEKILQQSKQLTGVYAAEIVRLDKAYAWRILEAMSRKNSVFSPDLVDRYIYQVDRSNKGEITIVVNESFEYDETVLQNAIADKIIVRERE